MSIPVSVVLRLKAIQAWDRWRLRGQQARHPGLRIHPDASSNLASAYFALEPGAELRIGAGVVTERRAGALRFLLSRGARVEVGRAPGCARKSSRCCWWRARAQRSGSGQRDF